jgi:hypothetical protein
LADHLATFKGSNKVSNASKNKKRSKEDDGEGDCEGDGDADEGTIGLHAVKLCARVGENERIMSRLLTDSHSSLTASMDGFRKSVKRSGNLFIFVHAMIAD